MPESFSIEQDVVAAREALERCIGEGGVALFPSDGLYGLACHPEKEDALARINDLKGRDPGKPSAVMFFAADGYEEIVSKMTPLVRAIASALLPGPVTLVIDNPDHRWPLACGENPDRLGIRVLDQHRLEGMIHPVLQTSANRSGDDPPAAYADVAEEIVSAVDVAIDGGELSGEPSTVIDTSEVEAGGAWKMLREGGMPYAEVEQTLTGLSIGG